MPKKKQQKAKGRGPPTKGRGGKAKGGAKKGRGTYQVKMASSRAPRAGAGWGDWR